ncbi:MAG: glycosyltransferase family 4 protein [Alphaproteobacteria bacterium]|nr:glycosyltransferase family 4 protein [Alphaproteobacteria bacterium]
MTLRDRENAAGFAAAHGVDCASLGELAMMRLRGTILVSNSQPTALIGALLFAGRHCYVTHGFVNGLPYQPAWRRWVLKALTWIPGTTFVACGPSEYGALKAIAPSYARIELIRNAIPQLDRSGGPVPTPTVSDGPKRLLFIGRIAFQKGLDVLLEALLRLAPAQRERFTLTVIGPGQSGEDAHAAHVAGLAARLGDSVSFLPEMKVTADVFARYDALVMPSRFEGLPYLLLEAAVANSCVICSDCPGVSDVVSADHLGFPFRSEDADALADALVRFADSPADAVQAKRDALTAHALADFSPESFKGAYERLLHG